MGKQGYFMGFTVGMLSGGIPSGAFVLYTSANKICLLRWPFPATDPKT